METLDSGAGSDVCELDLREQLSADIDELKRETLIERTSVVPVAAQYREHEVLEYRGNPLIEALVLPPETDDEIVDLLNKEPVRLDCELTYRRGVRRDIPRRRLRRFFQATRKSVDLYNELVDHIVEGYVDRNPMTPDGQALLYKDIKRIGIERKFEESSLLVLTGPSGVGKTATIQRVAEALGGGLIQHTMYKGKPFHEKQLLVLYVKLPERCSAERMAKEICLAIEAQVGETMYHSMIMHPQTEWGDLITTARRLARSHHVGLIVIDDAQWLVKMADRRDEVFAMLVNFRSILKIPVMLVGTHQLDEFLAQDASVVSRAVEGGLHTLELPDSANDEEWKGFCETLWLYQWVSKDILEPPEELAEILFLFTGGIRRLAIRLISILQREAIMAGEEKLDVQRLKWVYRAQPDKYRHLVNVVHRWRADKAKGVSSTYEGYEAMFPLAARAIEMDESSAAADALRDVTQTLAALLNKAKQKT